jgi:alkylation response protein AidB-like acyl-CoA dehydrogenase
VDFRPTDEAEQLRAELGAFLDELLTEEVEAELYRSGVSHLPAYVEGMIERGWFAGNWPTELGGAGLDPTAQMVVQEELDRRDAPTIASTVSLMVAKALQAFGTDRMRDEIVPAILRGETLCVLGFTEPECGSDVANAHTRAVRDGDQWVIDGSKMFTTNAHIGHYVYLLARTNPDVPKHQGLTMFLVPLDDPGIEIQPVVTLSGERTNIVYLSEVRVPDAARIGEVDGGWAVLTSSLMDEQAASFAPWLVRLLEEVEAWAVASGRASDPDVLGRIGRARAEAEAAVLLRRRCTWMDEEGLPRVAEGPMAKLLSSEALTRAAQDLFDLVGPDALRSFLEPTAPRQGRIEHLMRYSLGTTIYAGTSEVQRTLIAQRGLGLPR